MPHMRCPYCNYRLFIPLATEACPNCGGILPDQSFLAPSPSSLPARGLSVQAPGPDKQIPPDDNTATDPDIIVVAPSVDSSAPAKKKANTWNASRLSSIKGVVLGVQTQQEFQSQSGPDIVGGFFKFIRDMLWPVMETASQQREEKIVITQIRLRLADGAQRDARLEGRMIGANISLGDEITLWGKYRKGTLMVQRAYNHTSEARILTRGSASSPLILILSFVVLVVALYMLTSGFHHFSLWP